MQDCWKLKIGWDDPVPEKLKSDWLNFARQLSDMKELTINRHLLFNNPVSIEIHGFCDASKSGYGACLYVRTTDPSGNVLVRLACSKSRVAPIKETTIPRLELCGALTLSRLFKEARVIFNLSISRCVLWSDSTIVLQWLQKSPQVLNVFESNRVREIQALEGNVEWRHVRTKDNPADALSRGQLPSEFNRNSMWFSGPSWLSKDERYWPKTVFPSNSNLPGLKKSACLLTKPVECDVFDRFSSYTKLVHTIAYVFRMLPSDEPPPLPDEEIKLKGKYLTVEEKVETERKILLVIQGEQFGTEIDALKNSRSIKSSKIASLDPFLDEHGLLRVGGRLKNSQQSTSQKHPILLPSYHHVTDLIIRETHLNTLHAGIQSTLFTIRQRFWLLDGKNQVRKVVRRCVTCVRHNPNAIQYKMADLPSARVQAALAFQHTGMDFCGPFPMKDRITKPCKIVKVYGCIFIDMASRAVHIELCSDLTTSAFLAAFERFTNRRGFPTDLYSDNGTNFVGARNEIQRMYKLCDSEEFRNRFQAHAIRHNITWHFNPPASPHFGGIWEAAVKSFKHHFKRVVGEQALTFEQLNTLATSIEAILNSRPLSLSSTDPNDPVAITPSEILTGHKVMTLPENDLVSVPANRLTVWKFITRARQTFWKRWHLEYLSELQKRQKWFHNKDGLKEGDVVILIDKDAPCMTWELGVIQKAYPGSDKIVRVVDVKTPRGVFRRNSTTLCPLPTD